MRELTLSQIQYVNGGIDAGNAASEGSALGSITGAAITGSLNGAIRGGALGALIGATFAVSFNLATRGGAGTIGSRIGSWLYIQLN